MENLENFGSTIKLGRKIANDLGATSRSDLLGGWMAHYIAELIERYDNASGKQKEEAGSKVFDAVLKLWNHRYQSSSGFEAIKKGEAILETLSRLDPKEERPFYFFNQYQENMHDGDNIAKFSQLALGVDRAARKMLRVIFLLMASEAIDEETVEYVRLAMPNHLTGDLKSIGELSSAVEAEDSSRRLQDLLQELQQFGALCLEFGSFPNEDQ